MTPGPVGVQSLFARWLAADRQPHNTSPPSRYAQAPALGQFARQEIERLHGVPPNEWLLPPVLSAISVYPRLAAANARTAAFGHT